MKKRWIYSVLLVLAASAAVFPSQGDSLKSLLLKVKESTYFDSARFFSSKQKALNYAEVNHRSNEVLPELTIYQGNYFFYTRKLDSASACFKRALRYSKTQGSKHFEILSKIRLLYIDREYGMIQNVSDDLEGLLNECLLSRDIENELEIYNLIAIIHEEKGEYKKAVEFYMKGLTKAELHNAKYYQSTFLNNLGLVRYSLDVLDKALVEFDKSITIAKQINNERLLNHAIMNRCLVLIRKNEMSRADSSFRQVLQYATKNKLPLEMASAYANIGSAYLRKNDFKTGLNYVDSAIQVFEKFHFINERFQTLLGKCDILMRTGKLDDASNILQKHESEIVKRTSLLADFHFLKSELMYKKGNYKEAFENYNKYFALKNSERDEINARVLDELHLKYNVQKKEIELEREKSKSLAFEKTYQKERFFKWIVVYFAVLLLIGAAVLFYIVYNRKMREKQQEFSKQLILQAEEERSRIARDLHDDIGQSLSILKAQVVNNNSSKSESSKEAELEIERIIEQTRQIARALYPSYIEKMGLIPSVSMLAESVQKNKGLEVSFEICKEAETLHIGTKTHLFHIIQESVNNTLRHSGASALKIMISNTYNNYTFTYLDNGSWVNQNKPQLGIGLLSMKERVKIINGTSSIEQNQPKGFKLTIKFNA